VGGVGVVGGEGGQGPGCTGLGARSFSRRFFKLFLTVFLGFATPTPDRPTTDGWGPGPGPLGPGPLGPLGPPRYGVHVVSISSPAPIASLGQSEAMADVLFAACPQRRWTLRLGHACCTTNIYIMYIYIYIVYIYIYIYIYIINTAR